MVEPARRHGHFDPRFDVAAAPARTSGDLGVPAAPRPSSGLEWYGFTASMFPESRRHDGEALKAYEAYADERAGSARP